MTIHDRLKSTTADLHSEVECTLGLNKITKGLATYSESIYILYLVFYRAYKELTDIDFQPSAIDLENIGRRRDWLAADLHALATALPAPQSLGFQLPTSGHGFGCLYVLEGSALGGPGRFEAGKANAWSGARNGRRLLSWTWPTDSEPLVGFFDRTEHDPGEFCDGR